MPFWLKLLWATELFPALHTLRLMSLLAQQVEDSTEQVALWATAAAGSQLAECSWEVSSFNIGSGVLLAAAALIVVWLGLFAGVAATSSGVSGSLRFARFQGRCVSRDTLAEAQTPAGGIPQPDWDWDGYEACEPSAAAPSPLVRPPAAGRGPRSMLVQSPVIPRGGDHPRGSRLFGNAATGPGRTEGGARGRRRLRRVELRWSCSVRHLEKQLQGRRVGQGVRSVVFDP